MRRNAIGVSLCLFLGVAASGCSLLPSGGGPPTAAPARAVPGELEAARAKTTATPGEPYWAYRVGELLVAADSLDAARAALDRALAVDPRYVPAACLLSRLDFQAGRHGTAIERLTWVESDPGAPAELRGALALHLAAVGENARAEALVSGRAPATVRTYVLLKGDGYAAAAGPARDALDEDPSSAVRRNNYGITRLQAGDPGAAREAFLAAHRLDPELPGPLYNLAVVEAFYYQDRDKGRDWFARYRKLASEDPDGLGAALAGESASWQPEEEP
jgi:tetratricopeptide (TPR) repeat protein